jgi:hypothetical protein
MGRAAGPGRKENDRAAMILPILRELAVDKLSSAT